MLRIFVYLTFRWFLRKLGLPSKHYSVITVTFIFVFLFILTRNLGAIFFWYKLVDFFRNDLDESLYSMRKFVILYLLAMGAVIDLLNIVWGCVVCSLGLKTFFILFKRIKTNKSISMNGFQSHSS